MVSPTRPAPLARIRPRLEVLEDRLVPTLNVPQLHSNPSAAVKLFLDFDGHFEPSWMGYTNITTPAYDFDGDRTSFSDAELQTIVRFWTRVAEDFAPFNLDVTTVEPSVLAEGAPPANANGIALRVAIGGRNTDWYGSASGVAGINAFTNSTPNIAFVFAQDQSTNAWANAISHETGHTFGLLHQSEYDAYGILSGEYSNGDVVSWCPIMGIGLGDPVIQNWYNGPTPNGPTSLQDDMAVIAGATNGFGFRTDDVGNTISTATPLTPSGGTWSGAGLIGTNTDVDLFSFTVTSSDTYNIAVKGITGAYGDLYASNLDAAVELRNAAGTLLASASPSDSHNAEVRQALTPGTYYVAAKSNGSYGWIGQYTVTVDAPPAGITVTPSSTMTTNEAGRQTTFSVVLRTAPTDTVTIPVSSTITTEGVVSTPNLVFTAANWNVPQVVTVTGVDDGVLDGDTPYSITLGTVASNDSEYSGMDPADLPVVNLGNDLPGFVYYANTTANTIERSRLDGSQAEVLVDARSIFGSSARVSTPKVDLLHGKMYWTADSQRLQRANLDGSGAETILTGIGGSTKLALDPAGGKIYWGNNTAGKIQRANLDGTGVQDVLLVPGQDVWSLEVDATAGKLYWTQVEANAIRRANLDGSSVETLWSGVDPTRPSSIALDVPNGKMYWTDPDQHMIRRGNLDGTSVEDLIDSSTFTANSSLSGLALDVADGKLFWADRGILYRANLDGSDVVALQSGLKVNGPTAVHPGPDISVTHRTSVITTEDGGNDVFRVTLTTQPTANVTISLSCTDSTEGSLSTTSLTFTPANWNVTQTVTVFGVSDNLLDGKINYSIILAPAVSSDPVYNGMNPADVSATNLDKAVNQTKFYVVNDATTNQTFEYNAAGGGVETYNLNGGNAAPRGAASTAAGDKVWVVDANRTVYVYATNGTLLGSWTAGTLANNATVEGITTNGTDVWIIDAKSDKVYLYAGAASRLSGTQAATSSFALSASNTSPKDLVTDGASFWVVDDSTTDRVFKYNLSGTLLGSWTISGANTKPTGITLDPSNVSHLWIVDSGTRTIYQYSGATKRTSGSQAPAATFALAASNSNPQGIGDPPVGPGATQIASSLTHSQDLVISLSRSSSVRLTDQVMTDFRGLRREHQAKSRLLLQERSRTALVPPSSLLAHSARQERSVDLFLDGQVNTRNPLRLSK